MAKHLLLLKIEYSEKNCAKCGKLLSCCYKIIPLCSGCKCGVPIKKQIKIVKKLIKRRKKQ